MHMITPSAVPRGLPKKTQSLCPECKKIIDAVIREEGGKAVMEKDCPDHGHFKDTVWSDVEMYLRAEEWAFDGIGVENPKYTDVKQCPEKCGLCNLHLSHTNLANVDLTNRCNLKCPICFANANQAGYVFEPSFEQVTYMLETLRAEKPVPTHAIQFAGGEPTIYPRFFDAISKARELGFSQVQVATNGIKLADEDGIFCRKMREAGMHTIYLQFDGLREIDYERARGSGKLLHTKMKAIENCRKTDHMPVVLVPTIVNGLNDDQVGPITDFAVENSDTVRAVNFQPVAFTGRITQEEREQGRYTLPDLVHGLSEQTDYLEPADFYPIPVVSPLSRLVSLVQGEPIITFTPHAHCGLSAYLYVDNGKAIPITRFVDVDGLFKKILKLGDRADTFIGKIALSASRKKNAKRSDEEKTRQLMKQFNKHFAEYFDTRNAPESFDIPGLITNMVAGGHKDQVGDFTWKTVMVGGMHFQDLYNYDIERVRRCVVHYATPDGRIIPFCAYNGGPTYREEVEKKFAIPLDEWRKRHGGKSLEG